MKLIMESFRGFARETQEENLNEKQISAEASSAVVNAVSNIVDNPNAFSSYNTDAELARFMISRLNSKKKVFNDGNPIDGKDQVKGFLKQYLETPAEKRLIDDLESADLEDMLKLIINPPASSGPIQPDLPPPGTTSP